MALWSNNSLSEFCVESFVFSKKKKKKPIQTSDIVRSTCLFSLILHRLDKIQRVHSCDADRVCSSILEHSQRGTLVGGAAGIVHPVVHKQRVMCDPIYSQLVVW